MAFFATAGFRQARLLRCISTSKISNLLNITTNKHGSKTRSMHTLWTDIKPILSVNPKLSLVDEDLIINASGLVPGQQVTVRAELKTQFGHGQGELTSLGCYVADERGCISTSKQGSTGGTFSGNEPLGLIWSLQSTSKTNHIQTITNKYQTSLYGTDNDPRIPVVVRFTLLNGHVSAGETRADVMGEECEIYRHFLVGNFERMSLDSGPLRGDLFIPTDRGSRPLPAIIDFRGAENSNHRLAALLASHGYVTMTTGYPRIDGESDVDTGSYIDVTHLQNLLEMFSSEKMVDASRIGAISRGQGVAMGLGMLGYLKRGAEVQCLVGVNGVTFNTDFGWTLEDGSKTGYFPYSDKIRTLKPVNGVLNPCSQLFEPFRIESQLDPSQHGFIPVDNIQVPMIMFTASENPYLPSRFCMEELRQRMSNVGRQDLLEIIEYPSAGHHLDPTNISHAPLSRGSVAGVTDKSYIFWGGEVKGHMQAQRDMWKRTLDFFKHHLQE